MDDMVDNPYRAEEITSLKPSARRRNFWIYVAIAALLTFPLWSGLLLDILLAMGWLFNEIGDLG